MLPWDKRPIEIANLFNPAFLSLLLHEGSLAYHTYIPKVFSIRISSLIGHILTSQRDEV